MSGGRKIFVDERSGKDALRPEPKACSAFLDRRDTLMVPLLDDYGRTLQECINAFAELRARSTDFGLLVEPEHWGEVSVDCHHTQPW
ncbi:recombinase family protein [Streptomyces sp. JV185]|uniref:recombinase family protein n=1 Tax=Streptomyces sp. JV185 TaxID=858638 RepID=UPI002E7AA4E9|nr:recombinase family protein [Streptomyces sp. JV185]MEE1770265.1 recombinase family protein [Streptomyces sp. JV185]